jgi:alpha/beta superfamily hydrolase
MTEERITIDVGGLKIEGLLDHTPDERGVVVTHPHPQYGGTMHNNVVKGIVRAYREKGYSTLRFNFRGVERSEGDHDNGVGEQEDVRSALKVLENLDIKSIDLAGYSFGAWVNAMGLGTFERVDRMIMVSPPVGLLDFDALTSNLKVRLVIAGSLDDIAPVKAIEEKMPLWNSEATLHIIEGADHMYLGEIDDLKNIINDFLENSTV